jgi:hypothetical protein
VKAAVLDVQPENAGRGNLAEPVAAERIFDRGDAFIGRQQPLDVCAGDE